MTKKCNAAIYAALLIGLITTPVLAQTSGDRKLFLPQVARSGGPASACANNASAQFGTIDINGGYYKGNRLTDENVDFRLSILGYAQTNAPLGLVNYNGDTDPNAPKFDGIFRPPRVPGFVRAHKRHDWNWDENAAPPYGARGGVNNDWPVSALDLDVTPGESIYLPRRGPEIGGGFIAMALYVGETELTAAYYRQDNVADGYVIHMANFCVNPGLVSAYRDQLRDGKRATGKLPGIALNQAVGTPLGDAPLTIAIRDRGGFLDPRSRKDWWP
jgi:hypothetical protein